MTQHKAQFIYDPDVRHYERYTLEYQRMDEQHGVSLVTAQQIIRAILAGEVGAEPR